ncbi:MAG: AbrB/MazE/SpoVT family DNA-binding protein [Pseudonocardiales bacterium]|nr:AbrB/MazE/SpoVT family DNA-binding protein [Pseudonocardiales bacterium]
MTHRRLNPPRGSRRAPLELQFGTYNDYAFPYNYAVTMAEHTMTISRNGQVSIPAAARARWRTRKVLVVDLGDRVVMRPVIDDGEAVAQLQGKYAERGPDTTTGRATARRADEATALRRR